MKNFWIACAGLAVLVASPSFAAEDREAAMDAAALKAVKKAVTTNSATLVSVPSPAAIGAPAASVPPIVGTLVIVGEDDLSLGLPCFNCAPAPNGGYGLSVPYPLGYVPTSLTSLDYIMSFEDNTFTGTCTLAFALMQGTTVIDSESISAGIYPSIWYVQYPRTRPSASGNATLYGYVMCNGVQQSMLKSRIVLQ